MTVWQASILCLIPLFMLQRVGMGWPWHKMRVAAALLVAAFAGRWVTPDVGVPPVLWYAVIDFMAAFAVLARPAGAAQKAIGVGFGGMLLYHAGFAFGLWWWGPNINATPYYDFMTKVGWLQFAILAAWGSWDSGSAVYNRFLRRRPVFTDPAIKGAG